MKKLRFKVCELLGIPIDELEDMIDVLLIGCDFYLVHQGKSYKLLMDQILFMKHVLPEYLRLKLPKLSQIMMMYELPIEDEYIVYFDYDPFLNTYPMFFDHTPGL